MFPRPPRRPRFGERLLSDCLYGLFGGVAICGAGLVGAVERRDPEWWRGERDPP